MTSWVKIVHPSSHKKLSTIASLVILTEIFIMNSTTTTMPCTRAYIEMMRGRRGDRRCCKCGWFGHLARHCRQREILAERQRKPEGGSNKFAPLLSKVCRRTEGGIAAHPYKGKAQPMVCWGYGEEGHVLWGCPNRVALLHLIRKFH